jgi:hypothetical protein
MGRIECQNRTVLANFFPTLRRLFDWLRGIVACLRERERAYWHHRLYEMSESEISDEAW